nr:DNA-directed RNA polymerases I and III subunit RPAC1 [Seculamonas ecuadoriensis]
MSDPVTSAIDDMRKYVTIHNTRLSNPGSFAAAGTFRASNIDTSFDIDRFRKQVSIAVKSLDEEQMVFDLVGADAAIANALRRVMIGEVPLMAIEYVSVINNTSITPDEMLAHRLGLIPILAPPSAFEYRTADDEETETNSIRFSLNVTCEAVPNAPEDAPDHERYINHQVTSKMLVWEPIGSQRERFGEIRPVHDDILITKLRPGQSVHIELVAVKGIGADHAKFSPVATASYRLLPHIAVSQELDIEDADRLVQMCPMNVFEKNSRGQVDVVRPRNCTMCRECIRHPGWDKKVSLKREKNHFIFTVETTGVLSPPDIVREGLGVLKAKCDSLLAEMNMGDE